MRRHVPSVLLVVMLSAAGCGSEDAGRTSGAPCLSAGDCSTAPGPCVVATCVGGQCGIAPLAAGTVFDTSGQGDCQRRMCDGAGGVDVVADATDLPVDGNDCTLDRCSGGVASNPVVEAGVACAQDGGAVCDGAGACIQCRVAADCPGSDTECSTRTCTGGICGATLVPFATPLAAQVPGDCSLAVCDGAGGTTTEPADADLPVDGNACTADRCAGGVASNPPVAPGTGCTGPDGGAICDGSGACVQCVTAATCPGADAECQQRTCTAGACGIANAPPGTPVAGQTAGDCLQNVCDGTGAIVSAALASDVPDDGDACSEGSCAGGTPSNPAAAAGTACAESGGTVCDGAGACVGCNVGADCASGVCVAQACQAPDCSDAVKNGAETDVDCGGGTCAPCAAPQACLVGGDCTSGVCTSSRCATPTCGDHVKNGTETDVDCGGDCYRCYYGQACLVSGDCYSANCEAEVCEGPLVSGTVPVDGAADVAPATAITLSFAATASRTSVTAQTSSGPCSGSVQLSADDFATCVGMVIAPMGSYGVTSATLQPTRALEQATTYRIRTTNGLLTYASSLGAFEPFETAIGFTTASGGACAGALVISQIYAHGGLSGAAYRTDFVELHNNGPTPVSLDGLSVQYAPATGYAWLVTPLAGTIPAGGHFLVRESGGTSDGALLPAYDASGTIDLSPAGGVVVLASSTVPFSTGCPSVGRLDLVGYGARNGTPITCFEGAAPAPAPADSGAALVRAGGGCADGNGSAADLASQLAVPRSSASAPSVCGCNGTAVNGTGLTVEMDACSVDHPLTLTAAAGRDAGPIYGRVDEYGVTQPAGAPPALMGDLGFGPAGTDPRYAAGWTFVPATWSSQGLTDDEFQASFNAPSPGSYVYVYRFSPDGQRWTYCDPNGAGSAPAAPFGPNSLPALTVTP